MLMPPLRCLWAEVLGRKPGGTAPTPGFSVIAENGFQPARENRGAVIKKFMDNPELGEYRLFATKSTGEKVLVAEVIAGNLNKKDPQLFDEITSDPVEMIDKLRNQPITKQGIDNMTKDYESGFAKQVRTALEPYIGHTWEEAVEKHSKEKPSKDNNDEPKR